MPPSPTAAAAATAGCSSSQQQSHTRFVLCQQEKGTLHNMVSSLLVQTVAAVCEKRLYAASTTVTGTSSPQEDSQLADSPPLSLGCSCTKLLQKVSASRSLKPISALECRPKARGVSGGMDSSIASSTCTTPTQECLESRSYLASSGLASVACSGRFAAALQPH